MGTKSSGNVKHWMVSIRGIQFPWLGRKAQTLLLRWPYLHPPPHTVLGCPRNNQIFFSVRTETNRNSICFGCFSVYFAKPKNIFFGLFRFVSVFRIGIETTETNRIFSKQTEKISKKRSLLGGPRNH
jgi:hypothetical protein